MKLHAELGDNTHEIEIKREDGKVFARVDDREYELEVSEPETGVYLLKHNGKIFEASVQPLTTWRSCPDNGSMEIFGWPIFLVTTCTLSP